MNDVLEKHLCRECFGEFLVGCEIDGLICPFCGSKKTEPITSSTKDDNWKAQMGCLFPCSPGTQSAKWKKQVYENYLSDSLKNYPD